MLEQSIGGIDVLLGARVKRSYHSSVESPWPRFGVSAEVVLGFLLLL